MQRSAGQPGRGGRSVGDSNLDWGQDLRRLRVFVDAHHTVPIAVDDFGGGSLTYELGESRPMVVGQGPASGLAGRLGHGVTDSARPLASGPGVAARRCLCVVAGPCACGHHRVLHLGV
jgi:hypothetical protein